MTRIIALMALTTLGSSGEPFHEPFHDPPQRPLRSVTMRRARAPLPGAVDNGGAPNGLRAQNGSVCHVMACPGFGHDYRTCRIASVVGAYIYAQDGILTHGLKTFRPPFLLVLVGNHIAEWERMVGGSFVLTSTARSGQLCAASGPPGDLMSASAELWRVVF